MTLTSATTLTPSLTRRTLHLASLRLLASTLLAVTLLLLNGCGRDHGATVSGTVTLDGAPLQAGKITFHPVGDGLLPWRWG